MRRAAIGLAILLVLVVPAVPAGAQSSGEALIREKIASVYAGDFPELSSILDELRAAGLGYGEIIMALQLAKLSGQDVMEILAMHQDGRGWGQIARDLGIDPAELGRAVAQVMSAGKSGEHGQAASTNASGGKPEHTPGGPPEAPGGGRNK